MFEDGQDLTADDLNDLARRLAGVEDVVRPWRVTDDELSRAGAAGLAGEAGYRLVRWLPWLLAAGAAAGAVLDARVWPAWAVAATVGAVLVGWSAWDRGRERAARWQVRERQDRPASVRFRRRGEWTPDEPADEAAVTGTWLGRRFGVRWVWPAGQPDEVRVVGQPTGTKPVGDSRRGVWETADVLAATAALGLAAAREAFPALAAELRPEGRFLVFEVLLILVVVAVGRVVALVAPVPERNGGAR